MIARRLLSWIFVWCAACESAPNAAANKLSREQLLDPVQCKSCHPQHYQQWASSMHAYASIDPVFVAMNQRGQRETRGALGTFCVQCHAPMAQREGATEDGLNLSALPSQLQGVTCYVCHNTVDVGTHYNNGLQLANDTTMRAAVRDPIESTAHALAYGVHQDGNQRENAELCGSCHDVVTPLGVQLERSFAEYKRSLFGKISQGFETCAGCHMPGREGRAAQLPGAPQRTIHEHLWAGVDVALTPFPDSERQKQAVACNLALNTRIRTIDHDGFGTFNIQTETSAGHRQPSGAAQDRRMWLELQGYDAQDDVIFESGAIADDEVEEKQAGERGFDPQLTLYRDWLYDAAGQPTHDFWSAAASVEHPNGYESSTLPYAVDPAVPHTSNARFTIARYRELTRLTVKVRMRPIGLDVLRELVDSGDLDPTVMQGMPTFTLYGAALEWRPDEPTPRSLLPASLVCPN